ncbi:hypothetical protein ACMFMG_006798 [Clarireedia jacksonii]
MFPYPLHPPPPLNTSLTPDPAPHVPLTLGPAFIVIIALICTVMISAGVWAVALHIQNCVGRRKAKEQLNEADEKGSVWWKESNLTTVKKGAVDNTESAKSDVEKYRFTQKWQKRVMPVEHVVGLGNSIMDPVSATKVMSLGQVGDHTGDLGVGDVEPGRRADEREWKEQ